MKIDLEKYKANRVDKIDGVTTGINIERSQKEFIEDNHINLSALVRDVIDSIMVQRIDAKKGTKKRSA